MSDKSAIEWTEATWNPVTGCTKVSAGCAYCYIDRTPPFRMAGRKFERGNIPVILHHDRLGLPMRWRKAKRVFVNSLSDLFHDDVPDEFIDRVFATMAACGVQRQTCKGGNRCQHEYGVSRGCYHEGEGFENPIQTFQVLTKRPERMRAYMTDPDRVQKVYDAFNDPEWPIRWDDEVLMAVEWPLPNVWLGVTAENQRFADERIPTLLETPAAVRFVSLEPLLGPIDLRDWELSWAIVGGESGGPKDRALVERRDWPEPRFDSTGREIPQPMLPGSNGWWPKEGVSGWVRSLRDQCVAAGVPFLFKQWGGPRPKSAGRMLDGRTWDEYPA